MNIFLLIALFFITQSVHVFSMNTPSALTPEETECFTFFDKNAAYHALAYKALSEQDKTIIHSGMSYSDHMQEVKNALDNYATEFCTALEKAHITPAYDAQFISATLLKMKIAMQNKKIEKPTDHLSARMYVFSQLLTPQEKAFFHKDTYLQDKSTAHQVVRKCGLLLADELVKIKLIEDTPDAKELAAQEYTAQKIADLEKYYN